jgi:Universal stress protein family
LRYTLADCSAFLPILSTPATGLDPPVCGLGYWSTAADLLVVGSRGRGGFTELLLGSVSHAAVLHSVCPVVVVPSHREERGAG